MHLQPRGLGAKTPPIKTLYGTQEHVRCSAELEIDNMMDFTNYLSTRLDYA
jgi:hypothetical protein